MINVASRAERWKKCPVYLPWLGNVSTKFQKQITTAIQRCYFAVEAHVVFTTRPLLSATNFRNRMYYLPITTIMLFNNLCATAIVGTEDVHLKGCIKQHVFRSIRNHYSSQDCSNLSHACTKAALLKLSPMTLLLDSIFWKTLPVPTSPLLKLRLSNLFNLISVDTRNFFAV